MAIYRAQISVAQDSVLPRDRLVMTPHFEVAQGVVFGSADTQQLADDLAAAISGWMVTAGSREVNVKIYDAQGTVPVFPVGDKTLNTGAFTESKMPRELACCLSFFASQNRARQRGRLFVPVPLMYSAGGSFTGSVRPPTAIQQKAADLVPILAALGGANVDWVVYSRADDDARKVTNWFVDDEWDIIRSRGLRPSSRMAGTTGG